TRRAIATLEAIALDECGLQRMEPLALSQALDGRDLAPVYEGSKREARFHAFAIHQDRAGAALAEATAFLRACQMQVLAQRIEERSARTLASDRLEERLRPRPVRRLHGPDGWQ